MSRTVRHRSHPRQCSALTVSGRRCRRRARAGGSVCRQHRAPSVDAPAGSQTGSSCWSRSWSWCWR